MEDSDRVRLLYRTAKLLKSEITDCQGISVQMSNISYLTLTKLKEPVLAGLYRLLRWVIATPDEEGEAELSSPKCSNSSDVKRVLVLAQDIVHCVSHAGTNMAKHAALGIVIRHMTRSKQLMTMLSRMGHCNSIMMLKQWIPALRKTLAKSYLLGVVVPSSGVFFQDATNNNDINEETLDGKKITPATTMVLFQQVQFGPALQRTAYADQSKRTRSLESTRIWQAMREYSAYGKRPFVTSFLGKVQYMKTGSPVLVVCILIPVRWTLPGHWSG